MSPKANGDDFMFDDACTSAFQTADVSLEESMLFITSTGYGYTT